MERHTDTVNGQVNEVAGWHDCKNPEGAVAVR